MYTAGRLRNSMSARTYWPGPSGGALAAAAMHALDVILVADDRRRFTAIAFSVVVLATVTKPV
jgi:hypothetical protein